MENAVRIGEQTGLRLINSGAHRGEKGQYRDGSQIFARRLCSATGYGGVLFRSAGAEAKAQALTLARTYGMKKYGPQRCRILVLTNRDFDLWLANAEGVFRVAPQAPEELAKKLDGTVCALVFSFWEPGGAPLSSDYVKELFRLCRSAGVLTISDETELGLGRTGTLLAGEGYGVKPDMTLLSQGLPFGACLLRGGLEAEVTGFMPGPSACAQAMDTLEELLAPGALEAIGEKGAYLAGKLRQMEGLSQVRGMGLALSALLREPSAAHAAVEAGGLGLWAQDEVLLFRPELRMGNSEMAQALARLSQLLSGK